MQGLDVADAPLRAFERCSPIDKGAATTMTTTATFTPAVGVTECGCGNRADVEAAMPSGKVQRLGMSPFTPRVAVPLTPAMRHSPSRYARSESSASTASPRTPRACSSPVVTFAPSTRFDQCRQRTNVAVRRGSDDAAGPALPAPAHDGAVRRIAAFSLVGPSPCLKLQQPPQHTRPGGRFALAPAPIPPPPTHRFFSSAAAPADAATPSPDMTESSSDDESFSDAASTDSLSGIDDAEDVEDVEEGLGAVAAAAPRPRPPPSLSLELALLCREPCLSASTHLRPPAEESDSDSVSDAEKSLTDAGRRPLCAAATTTATPPSPPTMGTSGRVVFTALEPRQGSRSRAAAMAGEADFSCPRRPQTGASPAAGLPLCDVATRGAATTVPPQLKRRSPTPASPPSTTAAPLSLDLDVVPHVLLADLQLDRGGGSAPGRGAVVLAAAATLTAAPPATPRGGHADVAQALHTSAWTPSVSTPVAGATMSRVTEVSEEGNDNDDDGGKQATALNTPVPLPLPCGLRHDAAADLSEETSANVSGAPVNFTAVLSSQPARAARTSEYAICPKEVEDCEDGGAGDAVAHDVTHSLELPLSPSGPPVRPSVRLRSSVSNVPATAAGGSKMSCNFLLVSIESLLTDEHRKAVAAGRSVNAAHASHREDGAEEDAAVANDSDTDGADDDAADGVAPARENVSPTILLENARGDGRRGEAAGVAIVQDGRRRRPSVPAPSSFVDAVKRFETSGVAPLSVTPPFPHPPSTPSPAQALRAAVECSPLPPRSLPTPRSLLAAGHGLPGGDAVWCPLQLLERSLATPRGAATAATHCGAASGGVHHAASPLHPSTSLSQPGPAQTVTTTATSTTTSSVLSASLPPLTAGCRRSGPFSPPDKAPCAPHSSSAASALPLSASVPAATPVSDGSPRTATAATTASATAAAAAAVTARLRSDIGNDTWLVCSAPSSDRELSSLLLGPPPQPLVPPPVESRPQQRRCRRQRRCTAPERSCVSQPLPPPPLSESAPSTFQPLQLGASPLTCAVVRDKHVVDDALSPLSPHDGFKGFALRLHSSRRNSS